VPLKFRTTKSFGPLRLTFTGRRRPSARLQVGPVGYTPRAGRWSVRLPGPFTWAGRRRRG
jgi:hypothetical protein